MSRTALWRREPASESQKKWLRKRADKIKHWKNKTNINSMTRGQASDMISRLIDGLANNWTLKMKEDKVIESHKIKKAKNEFLRKGSLSDLSLPNNNS